MKGEMGRLMRKWTGNASGNEPEMDRKLNGNEPEMRAENGSGNETEMDWT